MTESKRKFVILGQSRSGTTIVRELLASHPEIRCDGELLNKAEVKRPPALLLLRCYPIPYLNHRARQAPEPVYGLKLMVYHVTFPRLVVMRLRRDGWRIIHIQRRNILRAALSKILASSTGRWHRRSGERALEGGHVIAPDELLREMKYRKRWTAVEMAALRGVEHLKVVYEDDLQDAGNWSATARRILGHLGVAPAELSSTSPKMYERPCEEIIDNYREVSECVRRSAFSG